MFHMQSAFSISKLYDLAQNAYHDPVVFLLLINLIRYQCDQSSLFCIQFDRIEYSLINNLCIEWPADIIRYSHFVSPSYTLFGVFTGNHDNRNIFDPVIFVHIMQNLKSIHSRHYNIQKNQRYLSSILLQKPQTVFSVFCFNDLIIFFQNRRKDLTVHLRIIYDQDQLLCPLCLFFQMNRSIRIN